MPPKKIKARGSFSLAPAHSPSFPTNLRGPNNTAANTSASAAKTVNYREEDPESWFLILDLIFLTHNITSPQMKFHLVLQGLPTQMAASNKLVECFQGRLKDALPSRCPAFDWSAHLPWVLMGHPSSGPGQQWPLPHSGSTYLSYHKCFPDQFWIYSKCQVQI